MVAVIVSGMPAVGKTTVTKAISERFGLRYYCGGDILKDIAMRRGYKPSGDDWWDTSEGIKFLGERGRLRHFDKEVDEHLLSVAKGGNVVVTSYTLPWLISDAVKIWLKASPESRAKRMALRDGTGYEKALEIVRKRDAKNKMIYLDLYGIRLGDDLSVFDFVITTDKLSSSKVVEMACSIVKHFV